VRALVSLGYGSVDADRAGRAAIESGTAPAATADLVRKALTLVGG
jgi:hypothetical protein